MTEKKVYRAETGVALDANFATHRAMCEQCRRFKVEESATVALLCLEGSILWKRENRVPGERVMPQDVSQYRVSKAKAKKAMRYKGDE